MNIFKLSKQFNFKLIQNPIKLIDNFGSILKIIYI